MSLILGVHLPNRLFLAADTRLTVIKDGEKTYRDNFWKVADFGPQITCVVAGDAYLAGFILRKIAGSGIKHDNINQFRPWLEANLPTFIDAYLGEGGTYKKVAMIFGGYDRTAKKKLNSSALGDAMSKPFVGKEGVVMDVATNRMVIDGLMREFARRGMEQIPKDAEFEIDYPDSSVFAVEIELPNAPAFRTIPCYGVVLYAQKNLREEHATMDMVQKLETQTDTRQKGEDAVVMWSLNLVAMIDEMISKYSLDGVGGHKLTVLLTPEGNVIPMTTVKKMNKETGKIATVSDICVQDDAFCVRDDNGTVSPFEQVMNYGLQADAEI
ncbi:MAG: hypothetical protein QY323_01375 [Patescibacteria group bacterium]|nr:MAG: hypothetical protein QY323_01375 [Patescibacteria group bacterium]